MLTREILCLVSSYFSQITVTPIILTSFVKLCQFTLGMSMLSGLVATEMVILQLSDGMRCLGGFCAVCIELSDANPCLRSCLAKKH